MQMQHGHQPSRHFILSRLLARSRVFSLSLSLSYDFAEERMAGVGVRLFSGGGH